MVSADRGGSPMRTDSTAEDGSGSQSDFDRAVEAFRKALRRYVTGDPNPVMELVSRREDVTLANPLGPPRRGPAEVDKAAREGAAMLRDGSVRGFEEVARYSTPDLGYVLQIERTQVRLPDAEEIVPIALRVTMVFRREGDSWKVAHRHADPITSPRPVSTTIET
jgi:ketosteroid isomerase-like protein